MKKNLMIPLIIITIVINVSLLNISHSFFKSSDTNSNNYIQIGKIEKNKFEDISMHAYVAIGPEFTFGVELPVPNTKAYDWFQKLSSYPYHNWSRNRKDEIISMIMQNQEVTSKINNNFASKNDRRYLNQNKVAFSPSPKGNFFQNKSLHLFVAISNNAHIINNPKKINVSNEKNLTVEAKVNFKGNNTSRIWDTHYENKVNFETRYYITTAYTYNKKNNTYFERKRGSKSFYNDADLIIVDLGTTADFEERGENWVLSHKLDVNRYWIYNEMTDPYLFEPDNEAVITKADYNLTFIPSWNNSEILKYSITLGSDWS